MKLLRLSSCFLSIAVLALPLAAQTNTFPSSGNVGIGTTAPSTPLQVVGAITAGSGGGSTSGVDYLYGYYGNGKIFTLGSQYSSAASFLGYAVKAQPGATGYLSSTGVGVGRSAFEANNGYLAFWTGAYQTSTDGGSVGIAEKMRIDSAGNIGIGTTSPTQLLHIKSGASQYAGLVIESGAGAGTGYAAFTKWQNTDGDASFLRLSDSGSGTAYYAKARTFTLSTTSGIPFQINTNATDNNGLFVDTAGRLGIGTTSPQRKLDVEGGGVRLAFGATDGGYIEGYTTMGTSLANLSLGTSADFAGSGDVALYTTTAKPLRLGTNSTEQLTILSGGNVGIGTTNPTQRLSVNGTIQAKEVIVQTGWSDYVFKPDYPLASLSEVEGAIKRDGHLPGIPSAQEVAERGVSVGEMQSKLLAKIEELTLHVIDQEKRVQRLESENLQLLAQLKR